MLIESCCVYNIVCVCVCESKISGHRAIFRGESLKTEKPLPKHGGHSDLTIPVSFVASREHTVLILVIIPGERHAGLTICHGFCWFTLVSLVFEYAYIYIRHTRGGGCKMENVWSRESESPHRVVIGNIYINNDSHRSFIN